ncbi:MAG: peptidoglycan editing factor PgeF [Candidatus Poribacteria bacterium]
MRNIKHYWIDKQLPIICATSTRIGGVSPKPYDSLNLAYHVGDDPYNVTENRKIFCGELGIDIDSIVLANQVHSDNVEIIESNQAGCGSLGVDDAIANTDAMITISNSVSIGVMTADCVPVMIFDPKTQSIGIAHAGWKGAVLRIAQKTVLKMKESFGTDPSDCIVALGPSIMPCCYEVGDDVIARFDEEFGVSTCTKGNKLNLPRSVEIQLIDAGVKSDNIASDGTCTACNLNLFYSHRAENGVTGRMMSLIRLKKKEDV